jgi:hypothetical protein
MGDIHSKIKEEMTRLNAGSDPLIKAKVREYVEAVENGEPLFATGSDDSYRKIAEFGGIVLAGHKYTNPEFGYQFVTWEKDTTWDDKPMVRDGKYFDSDDPDIFNRAKLNFATRAGLVDETLLFSLEECRTMLPAVEYYRENYGFDQYDSTGKETLERLDSIATHLENAIEMGAVFGEQVSEGIEPMDHMTM